jgi:cyclic nucleotide-binding protein/ion transport protein
VRKVANGFVIATATLAALVVPAQLALGMSAREFSAFSWIFTIVFGADLLLRAVSPEAEGAYLTLSRRRSRLTWLAADVLAAVPFHLVLASSPLQLLRLLKLARVAQLMSAERRRVTEHWTVVRLLFFAYWLALSVHWLSCGWFALRLGTDLEHADYLTALYWCVQTLTTVGYGDFPPHTRAEMMYAMFVMVLGVGVYGYVIGNVASLLTRIDPARAHHQENMQRLEAFMRSRQLPPELLARIRDYNAYAWEKRLGYDETTILEGLPPGLRREVMVHLKKDVIEKVPFFRGADADLLSDLAMQLKPLVSTPGEVFFRAGDLGEEMYFISRGIVEIVGPDGKAVYATLSDGDFFGEIALLMNQPRSASARAITYCDIYALDRESFERVLLRHPAFHAHIEQMTRERQERTG